MSYRKRDLILPHGCSDADRNLANIILEKSRARPDLSTLYCRFLLDDQMKKFWSGFSKIHPDRYHQHLYFIWILNSLGAWSELDLRSTPELNSEIEEIKVAMLHLRGLIRRSKRNLFGFDEKSHIAHRAKGLGLKSSEAKWSEHSKTLADFEKLSEEVYELCNARLSSKGPLNFPPRYLPDLPVHKVRESAFRNFLLDEMLVGYDSLFETEPSSELKKLIVEMVTVVSSVDTSSDDVRKRFIRRRKSLFSKLSQEISFTYKIWTNRL